MIVSEKGWLFISELVIEGYFDKICDVISDLVLDVFLVVDLCLCVVVEMLVIIGQVYVVGEVIILVKEVFVDIINMVCVWIFEIGYDLLDKGFDGVICGVNIGIGVQLFDIVQGVDIVYEVWVEGVVDLLDFQGVGDQGLMFGYVINVILELMLLFIVLVY